MDNRNYPFTPNSSLIISGTYRLDPSWILGCMLRPCCGEFNYAYISSINNHKMYITADTGELLCVVNFDAADRGGYILGTAVRNGEDCGYMCCDVRMDKLVSGRYILDQDAFVFCPSVLRPRPGNKKTATNIRVAYAAEQTAAYSEDTPTASETGLDRYPINWLVINGNTVGGADAGVAIIPDTEGGIRIFREDGKIIVGARKDV